MRPQGTPISSFSEGWGVPAIAQWEQQHLGSAASQVRSPARHGGLRLRYCRQLQFRWQPWLESDPWLGNAICRGAFKKKKKPEGQGEGKLQSRHHLNDEANGGESRRDDKRRDALTPLPPGAQHPSTATGWEHTTHPARYVPTDGGPLVWIPDRAALHGHRESVHTDGGSDLTTTWKTKISFTCPPTPSPHNP